MTAYVTEVDRLRAENVKMRKALLDARNLLDKLSRTRDDGWVWLRKVEQFVRARNTDGGCRR